MKELANPHSDGIRDFSVRTPVDPTPQFTRDVFVEAPDARGYSSVIGTRQLREMIFTWGACRRMTSVGIEGVIPTIGLKEMVAWSPTLLSVRPGDTILVPEVAYLTYDIDARLAGTTSVPIDLTRPNTRPDAVPVFLSSPGGPDSHVLSASQPRTASAWTREHEAVITSDECYIAPSWTTPWIHEGASSIFGEAVYEGDSSGVIALYSLPRQSNFAGYRAAMAYGDPVLIVQVVEPCKHLRLMASTLVRHAMTLIFTGDEHVEAQRRVYGVRWGVLIEAVESLGLANDLNSVVGLYLRVAKPGNSDSQALVNACAELGTPVVPGDFYSEVAKGCIRIALTVNDERIRAACERLRAADPLLG